jgi:hypothetical protein
MQVFRGFTPKTQKIEQKTHNRHLRQLLATASPNLWVKLIDFAQRTLGHRHACSNLRDFHANPSLHRSPDRQEA